MEVNHSMDRFLYFGKMNVPVTVSIGLIDEAVFTEISPDKADNPVFSHRSCMYQ